AGATASTACWRPGTPTSCAEPSGSEAVGGLGPTLGELVDHGRRRQLVTGPVGSTRQEVDADGHRQYQHDGGEDELAPAPPRQAHGDGAGGHESEAERGRLAGGVQPGEHVVEAVQPDRRHQHQQAARQDAELTDEVHQAPRRSMKRATDAVAMNANSATTTTTGTKATVPRPTAATTSPAPT